MSSPFTNFPNETARERVLVVDSLIAVAELITVFLGRNSSLQVVEEAASNSEGLALFRKFLPTFVIAEVDFGDGSGAKMLDEMRAERPETKIFVYTGTTKLPLLYAALEIEPLGFVHKSEGLRMFDEALTMISRGSSYFSPYATALRDRKRQEYKSSGELTSKEYHLVRLIADGMSTKQIAGSLFLSPKTIENYRKKLMTKLGVNSIATLTRYALREGMLD